MIALLVVALWLGPLDARAREADCARACRTANDCLGAKNQCAVAQCVAGCCAVPVKLDHKRCGDKNPCTKGAG